MRHCHRFYLCGSITIRNLKKCKHFMWCGIWLCVWYWLWWHASCMDLSCVGCVQHIQVEWLFVVVMVQARLFKFCLVLLPFFLRACASRRRTALLGASIHGLAEEKRRAQRRRGGRQNRSEEAHQAWRGNGLATFSATHRKAMNEWMNEWWTTNPSGNSRIGE